jgi:hypothetical protein
VYQEKLEFCLHCLFVLRYNHVCGADKLCSAATLLIFHGRPGSFSLCWFSDELLISFDPTVTSFEILLWDLQGI